MSYIFDNNTINTDYRIKIDGEGSEGNPISFKDVADYLSINPFIDTRFPKTYGSPNYELTEGNLDEWTGSGDVNNPSLETIIKIQGINSIKYIKNGNGVFVLKWNENSIFRDGSTYNYKYAQVNHCTHIKFKIYVTNSAIKLDKIITKNCYSDYYPDGLYGGWNDNEGSGWNLISGSWVEISIKLEDFNDYTNSRHWWNKLFKINLEFSGGVDNDIIYIDDLYFYTEDVNLKEIIPDVYRMGSSLRFDNCYFKDELFNIRLDGMSAQLDYNNINQLELGNQNKGISILFGNNPKQAQGGIRLVIRGNTLDTECIVDNVKITGREPLAGTIYSMDRGGLSFIGNNVGSYIIKNLDLGFGGHNMDGMNSQCDVLYQNLILQCTGYSFYMRGTPVNFVTDNVKLIKAMVGYGYISVAWGGEPILKNLIFVDYLSVLANVRVYRTLTPGTLTLINPNVLLCNIETIIMQLCQDSNGDLDVQQNTPKYWLYYEFDVYVQANGEDLEGAVVEIYDKDGDLVNSDITDVSGNITTQEVLVNLGEYMGPSIGYNTKNFYPWSSDPEKERGNIKGPFKVKVSKLGFVNNELIIDNPTEKIKLEIALQPPTYADPAPEVKIDEEPTTIALIEVETE